MLKKILLLSIFILNVLLYAEEENSYGWNVPHTTLNIGGYLDMTYDAKREDAFLFNDIALLFFAHKDKFSIIGEVELSNISLEGKSNQSSDVDLVLERLELIYAIDDKQKIKIGRFHSDIGFWNQAPITILQDTTTKPHMVKHMYPQITTGALYNYQYNNTHAVSFTLQHNNIDLEEDNSFTRDRVIVDRHFAFAYHYTRDLFSWSLSSGMYREYDLKKKSYYAGIGFQYESDNYEIQAELFTQQSNDIKDRPYSGYLQTLFHIQDKQDIVLRFESYKDNVISIKEENYLLGYVYRPWNNIVFKAEYIYHSKLPLNRVVSSISVLF